MPGKLVIKYLKKDELEYELGIRGVGTGTVDDMLLLFVEERVAVETKLGDLNTTLKIFTGNPGGAEAIRWETQINHLLGRIDRMIPTGVEVVDQQNAKSGLLAGILTLPDQLHQKLDPALSDSIPPVLTVLSGLNQTFQAGLGQVHTSSPVRMGLANTSAAAGYSSQMIPPYKWDEAYQFYKDVRVRVLSWREMVKEFRREYLSAHHGEALFEKLRHRTQHPLESIGVYLSIMNSYFNRLRCSIADETKLMIIVKNLHPLYQDRLRDPLPTTLEDLRVVCRLMEERRDSIRNYVEPNVRRSNVLEKDLAYIEVDSVESRSVAASTSSSDRVDNTWRRNSNNGRSGHSNENSICYRGKQSGHKAIGCVVSEGIRYFKCDKEGYRTRNCPECNKQGNGSQRLKC
ncbi:hypothetical protein JTB14_026460 [Gonioctena quinquepunctata]|nr:hypothetical protein JTB14_026460 [Gonioctena quinquepunctata]